MGYVAKYVKMHLTNRILAWRTEKRENIEAGIIEDLELPKLLKTLLVSRMRVDKEVSTGTIYLHVSGKYCVEIHKEWQEYVSAYKKEVDKLSFFTRFVCALRPLPDEFTLRKCEIVLNPKLFVDKIEFVVLPTNFRRVAGDAKDSFKISLFDKPTKTKRIIVTKPITTRPTQPWNILLSKVETRDDAEYPQEEKYPSGKTRREGLMWSFTLPEVGKRFGVHISKIIPHFLTSEVTAILEDKPSYIVFKTINSIYKVEILHEQFDNTDNL